MGDSKIEWTDATWNCIRGCSRVSPGCGDSTGGGCYAERQAHRFAGEGQPYEGLTRATKGGPRWTGKVRLIPKMLIDPLKWRQPKRIFVNSMSDVFHEKLKNEEIAAVFGIMAAAPQHQYQCLTKRPERMRDWFKWLDSVVESRDQERLRKIQHKLSWDERAYVCWDYAVKAFPALDLSTWSDDFMKVAYEIKWPLKSVWLGVSVENQKYADERIPPLMETPAAIRFLSVEPLLGPVDLRPIMYNDQRQCKFCGHTPGGKAGCGFCQNGRGTERCALDMLDWVICGSESGPGARPMELDWVRSLRDQCAGTLTKFFLKQFSSPAGKKFSLPVLDGRQHLEFPSC